MLVANYFIPGVGYLDLIINPTVTNNYSKVQEYEADKMASEFCLKCFNMTMEKQSEIMQKLKETTKVDGGGFWADHPAWDDRMNNIKSNLNNKN